MDKEFEVTLSRTETRFYRVKVTAANRKKAGEKALETAGNIDFHDGTSSDPIYDVDSVEQTGGPKRNLVVDCTDLSGHFVGDGEFPPFVVFDVDKQENIAGPFKTRERAESEIQRILDGEKPTLDAVALKKWLDKIDREKA